MKAFIAFIMLYDDEGLTSSTFFLRKAKAMREKFMETACERALNSLSWSLHYEPITCSFFFAGGRMKIVSEPFIISTLRSEERRCRLRLLPSTRLLVAFQSKANGKQSTEVSKEKQDDNAQILFLFHCKRCISALVTIPYTS